MLQHTTTHCNTPHTWCVGGIRVLAWQYMYVYCSVLQFAAMCCSALQCAAVQNEGTGWQRPIGCLIFICHFPQKSPIVSGSFAENDLQLQKSCGSWPPCISVAV